MLNRQVILYISNSYQKVLLSIDTGFFTASITFLITFRIRSRKVLNLHNVINLRKETIPDTFISLPGIKVSGIVLEINSDISCYSIVFIR